MKKQTNRDVPRTEQGQECGPESLQSRGSQLRSRKSWASPGLGSSLLTIRASASPPLETEKVCLLCFHVFHLCLFITFPQLSVHSFLLGFVILLHNLMSSLPLPGGHACPPPPALSPFLFHRHSGLCHPQDEQQALQDSPPRPSVVSASLGPSPLHSSFSFPLRGGLSEILEQTISRTRDIRRTGAEDVPAGDRGLAG